MEEVVIALLPTILGAVEGMFNKGSSDKLAGQIRDTSNTMPAETSAAAASAAEQANAGLPGREYYQEQIDSMIPKTLSQAKEMAQTPSSIIDLAANALTRSNDAYNKLAVSDAEARVGNIRNYQNVLQNKGQMALGIQDRNNQIQLAGDYQEAQGTKDLMGSINQGVGNSISLYGDMEKNKYLKEQNAALMEFFKPHDTPTTLAPTTPTVASFGSEAPSTPYSSPGKIDEAAIRNMIGGGNNPSSPSYKNLIATPGIDNSPISLDANGNFTNAIDPNKLALAFGYIF